MRFYYIDYENVKSVGIAGIEGLSVDDKVKIFAKGQSDAMKFDDIKLMMSAKSKVVIDDVVTGTKNALDFQLLTDLLVDVFDNRKANINARYVIVSKDKGYDPAIVQMRKRGIDCVSRAESIGHDTGVTLVKGAKSQAKGANSQVKGGQAQVKSANTQVKGGQAQVKSANSQAKGAQAKPANGQGQVQVQVQAKGAQTKPAGTQGEQKANTKPVTVNAQNSNAKAPANVAPKPQAQPQKPKAQHTHKSAPPAPENEGKIIRDGIKAKCNLDLTDPQVAHIYLALKSSDNKNSFYNYFRTAMGEVKGREFYKSIKSAFDELRTKVL